MKTIGILGCGWLGLPLAQQLVKQGYTVKGSTTSTEKLEDLNKQGIESYLLNINREDAEQHHSFFCNIETLIITIPPNRNEEVPTYVSTFKKIIPHLHKHNIKHVIFTSSVSVYAASDNVVTEQSISFAEESTAQQIRAVEDLLTQDKTFTTCLLRLGGLFGAEREPARYICNKAYLDNPQLPINMIHLDDIIQFTMAIIAKQEIVSGIYNLVSPLYKDRFDYYNQRCELYGLTLPPLGDNNWLISKKVSGAEIVRFTGLHYRY